MVKKFDEVQSKLRKPMSELNMELARKLQAYDSRLECFLNFIPPPVYLRKDGYFRTRRKTKVIVGANKSFKTSTAIWEDVMIYTGMIPKALQGVYAFEKDLQDITRGEKRRPRHVRIIVQDYSKAWPETIKPMLLGDPDGGGRGFLPETWSEYDKESHMFHGPDGSFLSIMSVDPTQNLDPRRLRGPLIDHTHICENSLQAAYSESMTRAAGLVEGPKDVTFEFCPQDGFEDWTYHDLYLQGYDSKTDEPLPVEKQNDAIFVQRVTMRDNPLMDEKEIQDIEKSIPQHQVAFRVHGKYSSMAANPYFHIDMLQEWYTSGQTSDGRPMMFENLETNTDMGYFRGKLVDANLRKVDEKYEPVWRVWEEPKNGERYIIPADTAMGNPKSDFQVADVLKVVDFGKFTTTIQVAQLRMRLLKPGDFGIQCAMMAHHYGNCVLVPEVNNESGGTFVDRIRNYAELYTRLGPPTRENNDKPVKKFGWHTDKYNKPMMLETTYKMLQKCYATGFCPINSEFTLAEMMSFEERIVKDKLNNFLKTEWGNRPGAHDDTVICYSIGSRVGVAEKDRLSPCNLKDSVVKDPYVSELEKKAQEQAAGNRAFSNVKRQPSLSQLRSKVYGKPRHIKR